MSDRPNPAPNIALTAEIARIASRLRAHAGAQAEGPGSLESPYEASASPLALLCETFGLTPFERDVLLLCASVELDAECATLVARLQEGGAPTFSLALAALDEPHWTALLPTGPLRYWRLVEAGPSLTTGPLRVDERILHYLLGLQYVDERLAASIDLPPPPEELVPSHRALAERVAAACDCADSGGEPCPLVQLSGADLLAQRDIAAAAAALTGRALLLIHAADIPEGGEALDRFQRLWEREVLLAPALRMIVSEPAEGPDAGAGHRLERLIERTANPLILSSREPRPPGGRTPVTLEVKRPGPAEQLEIWRQALGEAADLPDLRRFVFQFDLKLAEIRAASADALSAALAQAAEAVPTAEALGEALWESCRRQARTRLDEAAQRIEPAAAWDDLVLPDREKQALAAIVDQVSERPTVYGDWGFTETGGRGLGLAALFAGPSGTGKTLAAEVLAHELRLDLYRVDLSATVSKYIGETEKNLRRIFDAAEAGGAILLFDEADALFGKRSEVRDSHDRHANIEVSYLLQRIEAYRGLAVLTTNLKQHLDQAFLRRLRFVVEFPFPDAAGRAEIWRRAFPRATPTEGLDFARLAQLNIVGGSIRNIALNAAFRAAATRRAVGMDLVRQAALAEYAKLEKTLTEAETRGWA
jgi:SpoVK/Ycf46/Vps4 family AAA+-type ATPase